MRNEPIRVLVVDDTVVYRKAVSDVLNETDGVEVVGVAANGKIALHKIESLRPDMITLDLEMPVMDGLEVLKHLRQQHSSVGVIMLSAFTRKGARATIRALELGAMDFLLKPEGVGIQESMDSLRRELCPKIKAFARKRHVPTNLNNSLRTQTQNPPTRTAAAEIPAARGNHPSQTAGMPKCHVKPRIVVIGISTGGPQSLGHMLPMLPGDLDVPVMIVQHMPPMFTRSLADDLNNKCALEVKEAGEGDPIIPGRVLVAPGGKQMKIVKNGDQPHVLITDDPPENSCRPSVDYLFRSAAHIYGGAVVGVIMTGMGNDGSLGCRLLKRKNAVIIAQDEATCVVYGMPKQPAEEGVADIIAPLDNIAEQITRLVREKVSLCK